MTSCVKHSVFTFDARKTTPFLFEVTFVSFSGKFPCDVHVHCACSAKFYRNQQIHKYMTISLAQHKSNILYGTNDIPFFSYLFSLFIQYLSIVVWLPIVFVASVDSMNPINDSWQSTCFACYFFVHPYTCILHTDILQGCFFLQINPSPFYDKRSQFYQTFH